MLTSQISDSGSTQFQHATSKQKALNDICQPFSRLSQSTHSDSVLFGKKKDKAKDNLSASEHRQKANFWLKMMFSSLAIYPIGMFATEMASQTHHQESAAVVAIKAGEIDQISNDDALESDMFAKSIVINILKAQNSDPRFGEIANALKKIELSPEESRTTHQMMEQLVQLNLESEIGTQQAKTLFMGWYDDILSKQLPTTEGQAIRIELNKFFDEAIAEGTENDGKTSVWALGFLTTIVATAGAMQVSSKKISQHKDLARDKEAAKNGKPPQPQELSTEELLEAIANEK